MSDAHQVKLHKQLLSSRTVVGIHIGASSVNVVQVASHKGRRFLLKAASREFDLRDGMVWDQEVRNALASNLAGFSLRSARIVCIIHDHQVFVRRIFTPLMPTDEIQEAVKLAMRNTFPFSLDEAVMDFRPIIQRSEDGSNKVHVLVSACPAELAKRYQRLFEPQGARETGKGASFRAAAPGVKVSAFIPAAVALESVIPDQDRAPGRIIAFMEMGSALTELAIYNSGRLEFSRKLSVAGKDITKSMTGAFISDAGKVELNIKEAEFIKREHGLLLSSDGVKVHEQLTAKQIRSLIIPRIEQLTAEVTRSFGYYHDESGGHRVEKLVLLGGAARLKGLGEYLSLELGVPAVEGDPFAGISIADPDFSATNQGQELVLALGAALVSDQKFNLAPQVSRKVAWKFPFQEVLTGFSVVIVLVCAFAYVRFKGDLDKAVGSMTKVNSELTARFKDTNLAFSQELRRGQMPDWEEILKLFSHVPREVHLSDLSYLKGHLRVRGGIDEEQARAGEIVQQLVLGLRGLSLKDARVSRLGYVDVKQKKVEFEIVASITGEK